MCTEPMPPSSDDGDNVDPWADDDSDAHGTEERRHHGELDREWRAREQQYFNTGYRDGLEDGKARTTQHGFDAGFRAGAAAGFEAGAVRGALDALRLLVAAAPPAPPPASGPSTSQPSLESLAALFSALPKAQVAADLCSRLAAAPLRDEEVLEGRAASDAAARAAARAAAGLGGDEDEEDVDERVAVSEEDLRAALRRLEEVEAAVRAGGGGRGDGGGTSSGPAPEALRLPEPSATAGDTRAMMDELRAALRKRLAGMDVAEPPSPPTGAR